MAQARIRHQRFNASPKGKARMRRWRSKNRPAYLAYLRKYHRRKQEAALRARMELAVERLKKSRDPVAKRQAELDIKAFRLRLAGIKVANEKDAVSTKEK